MSKTVSAASATVPRSRSTTSNEPARRRPANTRAVSGARARKAALRELIAAAGDISERAVQTRSEPWAIRYLETVRGFKPPPPPMSSADQVKLAEIQADEMTGVIRAVLEGLKLSDDDYTRGIDLAIKELRAASSQGWEPL
jgi:hypothetical protein